MGSAYEFRWNSWNIDHIANHDVTVGEAEYVVCNARSPYPEERGDAKWLVVGQAPDGTYRQVIYIFDPIDVVFVIHARPLTKPEKRKYRRRNR